MTRRKIAIEKIENVAARQVAFSKRRKGLFKKASELSTLCDAEIALFVFSASGKLFDYASTSMRQVIERRHLYSDVNLVKSYQPSQELQVEGEYFKINKELKEKTNELRQLNGEELQGLSLKDLRKLEDLLNTSLNRISKAKDEVFEQEIKILKKKEDELKEENQRLNKEIKSMEENRRLLDQAQLLEYEEDQPLDTSLTMRSRSSCSTFAEAENGVASRRRGNRSESFFGETESLRGEGKRRRATATIEDFLPHHRRCSSPPPEADC